MTGKLKELARSRDGNWLITISTPEDFSETYDELYDKEITFEVKQLRKRRSLDANAYAWVLIDQIAQKTGVKKTEVYRNAIRDIGGVSTIVCVQDKAVDRLCENWHRNGIGWQTETMPSKVDGCTCVILYYGSSAYDSKQMAMLIDSLIQDAESLGIATLTDAQIGGLVEKWQSKAGA